jgi:hypothetical protein
MECRYLQERECLVEEMSAQAKTALKLPTNERIDIIVATDILIYVEQYPNLVQTLIQLLRAPMTSPSPKRTKCVINGRSESS